MTLDLLNGRKEQINELALLLHRKGLSARDESQVMGYYFGEKIGKDSISNMAESFPEIRKAWESSQLDTYYKMIFCAALYASLRRGSSLWQRSDIRNLWHQRMIILENCRYLRSIQPKIAMSWRVFEKN